MQVLQYTGSLASCSFIKNYSTKGIIKKWIKNKFIGKTKDTMHHVFMLLQGILNLGMFVPTAASSTCTGRKVSGLGKV